jgi:CubicO group peptidase (beta-lactamase class C family)
MRIVPWLSALLASIMLPEATLAQNAIGDWWGILEVAPGAKLRLAVHIAAGPDGMLTGTFDSLDQNALGLKMAEVTRTGERLSFTLTTPAARYDADWDAATGGWRGRWQQSGQSWPLTFAAGKAPATPSPPPFPANWRLPTDNEVAAMIDARIAPRAGEGIVVGLLDPSGRRIVARGPAGATGFDGRTLFEIGSMSKVFTALILADMVSKGEVALDDPAEKYLPAGAHMPTRGGKQITLRDLATHMSGLPRLPDNMPYANPDDPYADYSERLMLEFLGRYQLPRDIGIQYEYSNLGFGLLGYLLARAAHTDYPALLAQRITGPLGLHDTVIPLTPDQRKRFAQGHDTFMRPAPPWTLPTLAGAGAIRSTAADMLTFLQAALDPKSPIAQAMAIATADPHSLGGPPGTGVGLAWQISAPRGHGRVLMHDGGTGGFRTVMLLEPDKKQAVLVLANAAIEPSVGDLAAHALLGAMVQPAGAVPLAPVVRTAVTLPPAELDRVVGRYALSDTVTITVARAGAGLTTQLTGQQAFPLFAEAPLHFFLRVVDAQLRFTAGADGAVSEVVLIQNGRELPAKKVGP